MVTLLAGAFLGWLGWAALGAATPQTRSNVLGFRVLDDHRLEVRFEVTASRDSAVTCSIQALGRSTDVVGISAVTIGAGRSDRRLARTVVRTRERAVTATLAGCRLVPPD